MLFRNKNESPGFVLVFLAGITDADPLVSTDIAAETVISNPKRIGGNNISPILFPGDAQFFCQFTGTFCIHTSPDQHTLGIVFISCDHIHQPMHTITEIDIDCSGIGIEHLSSFGAALVSVAGGIGFSTVSFGF